MDGETTPLLKEINELSSVENFGKPQVTTSDLVLESFRPKVETEAIANNLQLNKTRKLISPKTISSDDVPKSIISHKLTTHLTHTDLIEKPNITSNNQIEIQIMQLINPKSISFSQSTFGTTIVNNSHIGIATRNGKLEIFGPGRWLCMNPRTEILGIHPINVNILRESFAMIIVPKGQYGLASLGGEPIIMDEGIHVKNNLMFKFDKLIDKSTPHISHGVCHILQVSPGKYAKVFENTIPKILKPGTYYTRNPYFSYVESIDISQAYIKHEYLIISNTPQGEFTPATIDNKPYFLEGYHEFSNPTVTVYKGVSSNAPNYRHLTLWRIRVDNGQMGLAWMENNPIFIDKPGVYVYDNPNFSFVKFVSVTDKQISLGNRQRIIVYDGEVGVSYYKGKLHILSSGIHSYEDSTFIFIGFLSTQQQIIQLVDEGKSFLSCDTRDLVEIGIKSAVFYQISNPEIALFKIGTESAIKQSIKETSISTLQSIIRNSDLNQIAQNKTVHAISETASQMDAMISSMTGQPSAPLFFDHVHDEFISKLHDNFKALFGIEISNIRIESFKILDSKLAENISGQAFKTAETQTRLANLRGNREVAVTEQERDAAVMKIKADADSNKQKIETNTKNENASAEAKAKNEIAIAEAKTKVETIRMIAEAEANAIIIKAEAKKKEAELIGATDIGKQMALMNIQADMVIKSLQGTSKIFYLPYGSNLSEIPLKYLNLPTGQ